MRRFLDNKTVVLTISLILRGIFAILISFLFFYAIAILIGNFRSQWMIVDMLASAVLLIATFAFVTKKIHPHLKKFLENKIE